MKTVLITGGARGLGSAMGRAFYEDHNVVFTTHESPADAVLEHCPNAVPLAADLTEDKAIQGLPSRVFDHFGTLDIIINNAGVIEPDSPERFDFSKAKANYTLNAVTPMALAAAALPHLSTGAVIINITSTNARLPAMGAQSYSASKAALEAWTKIAAKTLGPKGIRVNAVAPGAVNIPEAPRPDELTKLFVDQTALGTLASPDDIANAARFLATDAAKAITGHILDVNGGYRL
ncbi:MAG: SDR family oxidoreductase [Marinovum sp.]|nr:SDR family oxidoreductase [Marinovum sp.]